MKFIRKLDSAKLYLILGQIIFMGLGYFTQVLLSKTILDPVHFSEFQFVNFLTNIFNLFFATAVPTLMLTQIPKILEIENKKKLLIDFSSQMTKLLFVQTLIITIISLLLFLLGLINLNLLLFIVLSAVQVISFGLMNITNVYYLGLRKSKLFFKSYTFYILMKSTLILLSAYVFRNIIIVLLFIILSESIQSILNSIIIGINPIKNLFSRNKSNKILGKTYDFITSNFLMFGITNLSVVLPFLGLNSNYAEYSVFTLIFPWTLSSFYIISAIGNIYLVDYAGGLKTNIGSTLKKILFLSTSISVVSLVGGILFFFFFYQSNFNEAMIFLILSLPSGIIISLISTVIAIYQGLGKIGTIRKYIFGLIVIYSVIILVTKDLKLIILISTLAYAIALTYLILLTKREDKDN